MFFEQVYWLFQRQTIGYQAQVVLNLTLLESATKIISLTYSTVTRPLTVLFALTRYLFKVPFRHLE